ncbi:uncharacterized protein LOC100202550 isoform X1 [Hydra vulgaris]|uniref:uncharacterized protein LOC100202550 isoform X1 n=1 Tax=Hydra vulgaris TaxID=6087 RepID=UPI0002B42800|nr:uncharacterized protein LOC100202550 [Hydra vulgaris]
MNVAARKICANVCFALLLLFEAVFIETGSINFHQRRKRGLLSRTGICPSPVNNFVVKDTRLNFFGLSITLPGDEYPSCYANECLDDQECSGDKKCCVNHCGAQVCTEAEREPHPCQLFNCPATMVCKIQRVRCIDPYCPDLLALPRPVCVSGGPLYEIGKRSRIPRPSLHSYDLLSKLHNEQKEVVYSPELEYDKNQVYKIGV